MSVDIRIPARFSPSRFGLITRILFVEIERHGYSKRGFCRASGISMSTLFAWQRGTYDSVNLSAMQRAFRHLGFKLQLSVEPME